MEEKQKIYIIGVPGRGKEVVHALLDRGAKNLNYSRGEDPSLFYYITHNGNIDWGSPETEFGRIIMDNYHEIKLPEQQWKSGDILINKKSPRLFVVFKGVDSFGDGRAHLCVDFGLTYKSGEDSSFKMDRFRLASQEETAVFYRLLNEEGIDWDAKKKQIVLRRWMPKAGERFYYVDETGDAVSEEWDERDPVFVDLLLIGNCFRTREEAETMAEKFRVLLKAHETMIKSISKLPEEKEGGEL